MVIGTDCIGSYIFFFNYRHMITTATAPKHFYCLLWSPRLWKAVQALACLVVSKAGTNKFYNNLYSKITFNYISTDKLQPKNTTYRSTYIVYECYFHIVLYLGLFTQKFNCISSIMITWASAIIRKRETIGRVEIHYCYAMYEKSWFQNPLSSIVLDTH